MIPVIKVERMITAMLTILLVISMVASKLFGCSIRSMIFRDFGLFSSRSSSRSDGFREKKAISDPDTRADNTSKASITNMAMAASALKVLKKESNNEPKHE